MMTYTLSSSLLPNGEVDPQSEFGRLLVAREKENPFASFYDVLADIGEEALERGEDIDPMVIVWLRGAAGVNRNDTIESTFIREYNRTQAELRFGEEISNVQMSDVSNEISDRLFFEVSDGVPELSIPPLQFPTLAQVAESDAEPAATNLFRGDPAGWAGNPLFSALGYFDALEQNILETPGDTYDAVAMLAVSQSVAFSTLGSSNFNPTNIWSTLQVGFGLVSDNGPSGFFNRTNEFLNNAYGFLGPDYISILTGVYVDRIGNDSGILSGEILGDVRGDANVFVHAADGRDFIRGTRGTDLIDGGLGYDQVSFEAESAAFGGLNTFAHIFSLESSVQFSGRVQLGESPQDQSSLFMIEKLMLGVGDDQLKIDSLVSGVSGLEEVDALSNSTDGDIVDTSGAFSGVAIDLDRNTLIMDQNTLSILNFEHAIGGELADQIIGSGEKNNIFGNGGNDTIDGGAGKDELFGGADNDTISDAGDVDGDLLDGGSGNDELKIEGIGSAELRGGSGEDILYGNGRSDLYGGSGADEFHITAGGGRNIKDAEGHDKLFINGVEITEISNDVIFGIEFGGASGNRDYVAVQKGGQATSWQEGEPVEASIGIVFRVTGIADDFDGTTSSILYDVYIFEDVSLTPTQSHNFGIDPGRLFQLSDASSIIRDFRQGDFGLFLDGHIELSIPRVLHNSTQVRGLLNYEGLDLTTGEDLEFGAPRLMSEAELAQERAREAISENPLLGFQSAPVQNGTGEVLRGDDSDGAFTLIGATQGIALAGGGNDTVNGNDAALILSGGAGSDILNGGTSADLIFGDLAPGETSNDTIAASDDTISSGAGDDTIFAGEGNDSVDAGAGSDLIFGGSGSDSLSGSVGNDTLHGQEGHDTLEGGEGSDTLLGHVGDDSLSGGAGDDSLVGGDGEDFVDGGDGSDTLLGGDGADKLSGGADDDAIYGGADSDNIDGGSGNDSLEGATGDDTISGGAGDDLLEGGRGSDTYFYARGDGSDTIREFNFSGDSSSVDRLVFTDMTLKDITAILNINDDLVFDLKSGPAVTIVDQFRFSTLERVEEFEFADGLILTSQQLNATRVLLGTEGDDRLEGENASEELMGLGGNDVLLGGGGLDTLFGGEGNDSIAGGSGDDEHFGEGGDDYIIGQGGNDFVSGGDGNDRLEGSEGNDKLYGDAGSDTISGEAGNDAHFGGAGNDLIYGSGGDDTFDGGEGYDTLDFTYSSNNVTISLADETATFESGFVESVTGFEAVLAGSGNNLINGDLIDNLLHGGSGDDTLYGGDGNDTLDGGIGNDLHYGGGGNDLIIGNSGLDDYDGGTGFDTLDFSYSSTDSTINLSLETVVFSHGAVNQVIAFEAAIAGSGQNTLVGTRDYNLLDGGAGNDTLIGGNGSDELIGGAGQDTFVFADDTASSDTVMDYSETDDMLDITAWGATGYEDLTVTSVEQGASGIFDVQVVFGGNSLHLAKISTADLAQIGSNDFIFV